ncbi:polyprenyl diphosphate synthase [Arenicella sp.]|nr:polyprenyl diphosphate synthase [Arenicella sp.]
MFGFFKRKKSKETIIQSRPKHVAVIMDGNGRWANARGMTRVAGHKQGVNSVKSLIKSCITHEIPYLTIFAFSSENWSRPESEVSTLMDLLATALETQTKKLKEHGTQLKLIGDLTKFNPQIQALADKAQQEVPDQIKLHFSVAINYGGRWDITQACRQVAEKVASGELSPEQITESSIAEQLSTSGMPDPDFYIRTSGEYRLSNFMLWQAAYSEFYFTNILWPDFNEKAFDEALLQYAHRERRFGTANDQIEDCQKNPETAPHSDKKTETRHA